MIERDRLYLGHIQECIQKIDEYTAPGREHFLAKRLTQDAVMRNFNSIEFDGIKAKTNKKTSCTSCPSWLNSFNRCNLRNRWFQ